MRGQIEIGGHVVAGITRSGSGGFVDWVGAVQEGTEYGGDIVALLGFREPQCWGTHARVAPFRGVRGGVPGIHYELKFVDYHGVKIFIYVEI